jgi:hypothetical protein
MRLVYFCWTHFVILSATFSEIELFDMLWSLLWLFLWHSLIWVCFALYLITAVCTSRGLWRGCYNQGRLVTMEAKFWTSSVNRQVYLVLKLSTGLLSPDTCHRLGILDWNKGMQFSYNVNVSDGKLSRRKSPEERSDPSWSFLFSVWMLNHQRMLKGHVCRLWTILTKPPLGAERVSTQRSAPINLVPSQASQRGSSK